MKPFFSTKERIAALQLEAKSWEGTPFMPNASIKGAGVSCQKLVGAIFKKCGHLPANFEIPEGPMNWSHAQTVSLIEKFMGMQTQFFQELNFAGVLPLPGDMLGFKLGGCVHHCGIQTNENGALIHCMRAAGVMVNNVRDATYWTRLVKIWRPLEVIASH